MRLRRMLGRRLLISVALIAVIALIEASLLARVLIHASAQSREYADLVKVPACRVALVLGARVYPNGRLSPLLRDRLDRAVDLYRAGKVKKLLMSGDNRFTHYSEPDRMKEYAVAHGVPACDVAADYAGRRTYDSVCRAKRIFGQDELVVVTQSFHLDRAIFYCDHLGVKAYGVPSDSHPVYMRTLIREFPSCLGAFADIYLRHPHPVMGKKEHI
jgi:SanA protein